jgi:hypothetical protein
VAGGQGMNRSGGSGNFSFAFSASLREIYQE